MQFQGKVAIATGGDRGIGPATAKRLASEEACVVLAGANQDHLSQATPEVQQASAPEVLPSLCNVGKEDDVEATVQATLAKFGRLDVVVSNAGLMQFKPLKQLGSDDWLRVLNVDRLGSFYFIKQGFLHTKPGGAVVNVASIHAIETEVLVTPYAAAKTAVCSLTRSAASEGKPKGLCINASLPGAVHTPLLWDNPSVKTGVEKINASAVGKPEDLAAAIACLASDDAQFIQSAELRVDGGRLNHL